MQLSPLVDAAVSFDGTWAKRGFTSLTVVVFVLSVDTGEVLDYHVLAKECCKYTMKKSLNVMRSLKNGRLRIVFRSM